ncbi:ThiF family adenylyltransferase [Rhizobium sp. ZPR3]|uniref:ThiF family adenylyltransferase n=2 Tax=unclassified Rhizobium TaxID=2613769 RepID=A0AAU7SPQ0_9HYPH
MADADDLARLEVHAALGDLGFERDYRRSGRFVYTGTLDRTGLSVPVSIEITDFDFVDYPTIKITPQFALPDRKLPHVLGVDRTVCYYAKGAVILDRYDPAGTVLQCLNKCEDVIRKALGGKLNDDFAEEFGSYWSMVNSLVDLPPGATGKASVKYIRLHPTKKPVPVLAKDSSWLWSRDPVKGGKDQGESAFIVRTNAALSINPNAKWPPETLTELDLWLGWNDGALMGKIQEAIAKSKNTVAILAIRASNGLFLCRASIPVAYQTTELLKTRREKLSKTLTKIGSKISIERVNSAPADADYVFGRNLEGNSNLAGKRILLIGCGTIGSFLAQQLAQCGAGFRNGELTLVDPELLYPANLGRHLLGAPFLYENKANACAEFIKGQLPPLNIRPVANYAESVEIGPNHYDLVIDATGEEALSIALNHHAVNKRPRSPPHLFVWLEGNGAVAKSILTGDPDHACLKCLKPRLAKDPRHKTLKSAEDIVVERNAACGDGAYVPFPVSRSVGAAALACDHVLDWANGVHNDRFRSRTFDNAKAYNIADSSPKRSADCPACGKSSA